MIDSSGALLLGELIVLLVGVAFAVDLLQRRLGAERLRAWMGGPPALAALKGIGLGFVTPFCTYSAIPMLLGLRRAGVSPAGYVAFIVAAPVLDPVLFGALVLIVGLDVALTYVGVAFAAAMALALVAERVGIERHLKPMPHAIMAPVGGEPTPAGDLLHGGAPPEACGSRTEEPWPGWRTGCRNSFASAMSLLRSIWFLVLAGVLVGIAIEAAVDPELAASVTGRAGWASIPVAALLGTPLYFSTELFVPIADSLRSVGVSSGPIVALTIAGAGANLPEFVILGRVATSRLLATFVVYVCGVAVVGGLLAQLVA